MDIKGTHTVLAPDTAINREVELKLRVSPAALEALLASPLLSNAK